MHLLSPAPIVIGVGTLILYLGLAYGAADLGRGEFTAAVGVLVAGLLVFLAGIFQWIREDVYLYKTGYEDHGVMPGRDLGWWGMMFFLGTEITLFGGLFAAFFVARGDVPEVWVRAHEHLAHAVPLVTINTLILISSGVTMHTALHMLRKNKRGLYIGLVAATLVLGTIFLVVQANEYRELIHAGIILNAGDLGQFGTVFYILTGTHAFHVFLGLTFITIILVRSLMGQFAPPEHLHVAPEAFTIYWHFVDIVWIGLYFVVYLGVV